MKVRKKNDGFVLVAKRSEIEALVKSAKWGKEDVVDPKEKGKYKGKTQKELRSTLSKAKKQQEAYKKNNDGKAKQELTDKIRELNFALRAKTGWGDV
jgi:hypothetical protein